MSSVNLHINFTITRMDTHQHTLPKIVTREEWLKARKALLQKEKKITYLLDSVRAQRRKLPMVKVDKEYIFEGPEGSLKLADLFGPHSQLLVHHFMWFDEPDKFCEGCSSEADQNYNVHVFDQFRKKDVAFAAVSRAPFARIQQEKNQKNWNFPFYSLNGNDFNYDFHATIHHQHNREYNYEDIANINWLNGYQGDLPAKSVFLRDGKNIYHTYSTYSRGTDLMGTHYNYLDLTPFGRQEEWEKYIEEIS